MLMLATMQVHRGAPGPAVHALGPLGSRNLSVRGTYQTPLDWLSAPPLLEASAVRRGMPRHKVGAGQAIGRIAAHTIELFPPGISLIAPGWPINSACLDALEQVHAAGGRVVASDSLLQTIAGVAGTRASAPSRSAVLRSPAHQPRPRRVPA